MSVLRISPLKNLLDTSVANLSLCAKDCEDKVGFGHILGNVGQSALGTRDEGKNVLCEGNNEGSRELWEIAISVL